MIYFDNAATTLRKPPEVADAVVRALGAFGGVGRGVHGASLDAGMAVFEARETAARLLGAPCAARVSFAHNATAALNIAIASTIPCGGRAVTTAASHNSVLRPLFKARDERGCKVDVAPVRPDASLDFGAYERLLEGGADLVVATHASNLTGDVYDIARMTASAHAAGAVFVLDAAQTAGTVPIDMGALGADIVCFTGHKSLFGPQGTGGLAVAEGIEVAPLFVGGSGTASFDEQHPRFMPEALEAGTLNAHGLAGLAAGMAFVEREGVAASAARLGLLTERFECGAREVSGVRVLGGRGGIDRCPIVALDVCGIDSAMVADELYREHSICVRAGAHCAPLMHRALATEQNGAVRFSFSHFTTAEEIDEGISALEAVVRAVR
ncbi:aminotransferase class V-fold PLP-dependent enzyme [Raoultibacter phocaeensis]|uniref:aminotransferase class V-fold PLP-dependent enzyme n=1 Tax=Raoultibacter phocaeensis TaxID=2479841 RepID=UPI00111A1879|nr:aminotransferase class V-fold PLP-dependent enzyme [Raoultibacter phocaeensis]